MEQETQVKRTTIVGAEAVLWVGGALALPLWSEFHEPGRQLWNVMLAAFLLAIVAAAYVGMRHLQRSGAQVGEARFVTKRPDGDGR